MMNRIICLTTLLCAYIMPIHSASAQTIETRAELSVDESNENASILHPGDTLKLYVYGDQELSGEYRIDTKGILTLPLIGELITTNLDKKGLEKVIIEKLVTGGYYTNPKVTIDVFAEQPFYILGEVKNPGSYPYAADLDVFKAIAIAGGFTPRADKDDIVIMRKVNGKKIKFKATEDTTLLPGDSIKIEQRFF